MKIATTMFKPRRLLVLLFWCSVLNNCQSFAKTCHCRKIETSLCKAKLWFKKNKKKSSNWPTCLQTPNMRHTEDSSNPNPHKSLKVLIAFLSACSSCRTSFSRCSNASGSQLWFTLCRCKPPLSACTAYIQRSSTNAPGTGRAGSPPCFECCDLARSKWRRSFCPCSTSGLLCPTNTCWVCRNSASPLCGASP